MFIADLLIALAAGLVIVWIVSLVFGTRGPWGSFMWFFLVVFLFSWAGGAWLMPFGPQWRGIGVLPIIFVGILVALLLTAASPRTSRRRWAAREKAAPDSAHEKAMADAQSKADVDIFFWVLIICLLLFAISRYAWYPRIG